MPDITPSFVMQYERRMKAIKEEEYVRRLSDESIWWNKVVRPMDIEGKTERMTWFLSTATIEPIGPTGSGDLLFENLVTQTAEYPTFRHGKGIIIQRDQLEDLDGTGLDQAAEWSSQAGNEIAYYPQRLSAQLFLNGANTDGSANAYDGVPFFADNTTNSGIGHPYNPYRTSLGGYANWLHGSASGTYPGACPIDSSVTTDTAFQNLAKAIAYITNVKMPNGVDPRFLRVAFIMAAPKLAPRLFQLTDSKFIAQAASSGGGSADIIAVINAWGLGKPIIANEFGAAYSYSYKMPFVVASSGAVSFLPETVTGSDTTYYIVCQEMKTTRLGGLLYVLRKAFKINYYTGETLAELDRRNEFEYHVQGRMSCQYGHPYTVFRVDAS